MGLQDELAYDVRAANVVQRQMQRIASTRPGSWTFQKTLYRFDRLVFDWSDGRLTVPGLVAGLPVIMLTTTGARSGEPRTMPLLGIPFEGHIAVIGSNYGQQPTPGWVYNLEADPAAEVSYRGAAVPVTARAATPEEVERIFELGAGIYGGYAKYRRRADHRTIRVFVLEPAPDP